MKIIDTKINGVLIIERDVFTDDRGYFVELWNLSKDCKEACSVSFVQDNLSYSKKGVLRGLHYQTPFAQGKLIQVFKGEVYDVVVDLRTWSRTYKQWIGITLNDKDHRQLYIPSGLAHGFCVTGEEALFAYKCTEFYHPEAERGIAWNDPDLNIEWPVEKPILSKKDETLPFLRDIPVDLLPFGGEA